MHGPRASRPPPIAPSAAGGRDHQPTRTLASLHGPWAPPHAFLQHFPSKYLPGSCPASALGGGLEGAGPSVQTLWAPGPMPGKHPPPREGLDVSQPLGRWALVGGAWPLAREHSYTSSTKVLPWPSRKPGCPCLPKGSEDGRAWRGSQMRQIGWTTLDGMEAQAGVSQGECGRGTGWGHPGPHRSVSQPQSPTRGHWGWVSPA